MASTKQATCELKFTADQHKRLSPYASTVVSDKAKPRIDFASIAAVLESANSPAPVPVDTHPGHATAFNSQVPWRKALARFVRQLTVSSLGEASGTVPVSIKTDLGRYGHLMQELSAATSADVHNLLKSAPTTSDPRAVLATKITDIMYVLKGFDYAKLWSDTQRPENALLSLLSVYQETVDATGLNFNDMTDILEVLTSIEKNAIEAHEYLLPPPSKGRLSSLLAGRKWKK